MTTKIYRFFYRYVKRERKLTHVKEKDDIYIPHTYISTVQVYILIYIIVVCSFFCKKCKYILDIISVCNL